MYVGGKAHSGKLSWEDFTGKVPESTRFDANTSVNVVPRMRHAGTKSDTMRLEYLEVRVEVDSLKTWAKPNRRTADLLQHEQGHIDLFVLCAREMDDRLSHATVTRKNLKKVVDDLTTSIAGRYKELSLRYDRETEHVRNREKQAIWTKWIDEQIAGGGFSSSGPPQ